MTMPVSTTTVPAPARAPAPAPAPRPTLRLVPDARPPAPLMLRPAPVLEPEPYEPVVRPAATGAGVAVQQELPLHRTGRRPWPVRTDGDEVPTPVEQLPPPEELAHRLVQAAVDVLRGLRPASQVLRWTTPEVYSQLRQRARVECTDPQTSGRRPVVRSVRTSRCGAAGVEVAAVVLDGRRARAVAVRLDGVDGRWRMTALQIG